MKLQSFQNTGFEFSLMFAGGEIILVDLQPLIGAYISEEDLASAQIDPDWGCLEFRNGAVDTDPTTLYRYATNYRDSQAALGVLSSEPHRWFQGEEPPKFWRPEDSDNHGFKVSKTGTK